MQYLKNTNVHLVNKYAELTAKKHKILNELDEELEKLKEYEEVERTERVYLGKICKDE